MPTPRPSPGPFMFRAGSRARPERRSSFASHRRRRVSTERRCERRWTPARGWPALEFDGALADPGAGAKGPSLSGSGTLAGVLFGADGPMPWRAVGRMTADFDRATIDKAQFRLGPEERALSADGSATLTYGSPARLAVQVKAKQANIDALLRRKGEDGVAPARVRKFACQRARSGSRPDRPRDSRG